MKQLVPALSEEHIISSYVGVRVFNDKEYEENLIEYSPTNEHFINVLVRMPGFTPSPKIAEKVVGMIADKGLELNAKDNFIRYREGIPRFRFLSDEKRNELIKKDGSYGRVVCRCETITEGEIIEAIRRGGETLQGIMFRTRAGMGRCQRNWCGPKLMSILARELGVSSEELTLKGPGYPLLTG